MNQPSTMSGSRDLRFGPLVPKIVPKMGLPEIFRETFALSNNLEKHKRIGTGARVAVPATAPAAKKRCIGDIPEFKLFLRL